MEASLGLRGLSGLALSAALHTLAAFVTPRAPAATSAPVVHASAEVRFETLEGATPEPAPAEAPTLEPPAPVEPPASTARRPSRPRADDMPPAPAPPEEPPAPSAREGVAPSAPSAPRVGLDPRSVALSGYVPAPSPPTARRVDAESAGRASRQAAGAALDAHLSQANRVPGQRRRPSPRLLRRNDGGFLWRGAGISARILPNGDVRFSDRPGFEYDGDNPGASSMPTVSFRFDITDALERRHGGDPYYADRRWFMRETRQLRHELASRAEAERTLHEDRRLLGRLRRIAQDESRSLEARHRAIFQTFRDCADDERGERARHQILRFVREELPRGSPEAFAPQELQRLNAGSAERFEPYR